MKAKRRKSKQARSYEYDACLSFARENRAYVRRVAEALRQRGVRVFFDEYAKVELWGKDLYGHLDEIYQHAARYCVLFISKHYARRLWTDHERQSAQARAFKEHREYILPARFDSTQIPGLRTTVGYVDLRKTSPRELATLIDKKLGRRQVAEFFPPAPDALFARMHLRSERAQQRVETRARDFFGVLRRMNRVERRVVFSIFLNGCPAELPENVHVSLDLLRRLCHMSAPTLVRVVAGLRSLGFYSHLRDEEPDEHLGGGAPVIVLEWHDSSTDERVLGNATLEANEAIACASGGYCEDHSIDALLRLDFSDLGVATAREKARGTPSTTLSNIALQRTGARTARSGR